MGDIAIVWDPSTGTGDFALDGGDLLTGDDLRTASLISMFTEGRADPGDTVYDTDPRGVWFDTWLPAEDPSLRPIPNAAIGSKIWQVFFRPANQDTLNWLRSEIVRCHQWLIFDGIASKVEAETFFTSKGGMGALVTITAQGRPNVFSYAWPKGN